MHFKNPEILWCFFLIFIPVIIHLFYFRKKKKVYFSNIKILKELSVKSNSIKKLKKIFLLILRIAYISALILAFSNLYLNQKNSKNNNLDKIIYIDNSESMTIQGEKGELLSQAKNDAISLIKSFENNVRIKVLTNGLPFSAPQSFNKQKSIQEIEKISVSTNVFKIDKIINWLSENKLSKNQLYIFSDFQKSSSNKTYYLNSTLVKQYLPSQTSNIYIDSVWFSKPYHSQKENCEINFRLNNNSKFNLENLELKLNLEDFNRTFYTSIPKYSKKNISYSFVEQNKKSNKGSITVTDLNTQFDNTFRFNYDISSQIELLLINGKDSSASVKNVLNLEEKINISTVNESKLNDKTFINKQVIILNGLRGISPFLKSQLINKLNKNTSIIIFPGKMDFLKKEDYEKLLKEIETGRILKINHSKTQITSIESESIFFKGVLKLKSKPKINRVTTKHYIDFECNKSFPLIKLNNDSPILIKNIHTPFYLFTSSLSSDDSDIIKNALFPTIVLRICELSSKSNLRYFINDSKENYTLYNKILSNNQPLKLKNDSKEYIPKQSTKENQTKIDLINLNLKPDFYNVIQNEKIRETVSVNNNPSESKLNYYNKTELLSIFNPKSINENGSPITESTIKLQKEKKTWKLFIMLSLILIFAEISIIKFWK